MLALDAHPADQAAGALRTTRVGGRLRRLAALGTWGSVAAPRPARLEPLVVDLPPRGRPAPLDLRRTPRLLHLPGVTSDVRVVGLGVAGSNLAASLSVGLMRRATTDALSTAGAVSPRLGREAVPRAGRPADT